MCRLFATALSDYVRNHQTKTTSHSEATADKSAQCEFCSDLQMSRLLAIALSDYVRNHQTKTRSHSEATADESAQCESCSVL